MNNKNIRVTIICCYNNMLQYETFLQSLNKQTEEFIMLGIDNREQKYSSCSKAYNSVLSDVKTEYVIFSHQDIILEDTSILKQFVDYMKQMDTFDILGVAGATAGIKPIFSNVHDGKGKFAGEERIDGMQEFDTVDECFFGGTTECFRKYPFDEVLCNDWHLYAVERCLNAQINGHKVYACDTPIIHTSVGRISHGFNVNLYRICKKYACEFKVIRTTCANTKTNFVGRTLYYLKREVRVWVEKHFVYK